MATKAPKKEHTPDPLIAAGERLLADGRRFLTSLEMATRFAAAIRPDGTCPIFFQDEVFDIALPYADIDQFQMRLMSRHAPTDDLLLHQIIDLVGSLEKRLLIDVGSFTGSTALILRKFLRPTKTHLFEPQKTMRPALEKTIDVNGIGGDTTLHFDVIDDGKSPTDIGRYRPEKLSAVSYLRRADGKMTARSLDSFKFKKVGLINFDFNNSKMDALLGAAATIKADRPVVCCDLSGRDIAEIKEYFEPFDYEVVRCGDYHVMFLPR